MFIKGYRVTIQRIDRYSMNNTCTNDVIPK